MPNSDNDPAAWDADQVDGHHPAYQRGLADGRRGLVTREELQAELAAEVAAAGGAHQWMKKNKITGLWGVEHMVDDGSAATLQSLMFARGYEVVLMYRRKAAS